MPYISIRCGHGVAQAVDNRAPSCAQSRMGADRGAMAGHTAGVRSVRGSTTRSVMRGVAVAAVLVLPSVAMAQTVITVSPDEPVDSALPRPERVSDLAAALARARVLRATSSEQAARGIVIVLAAGVHRLTQPLRLGREDSGTAAHPLVIRGPADGTARLSGGVVLRQEASDAALIARYPAAARAHLAVVALPPQLRATGRSDVPRRYDRDSGPVPFEIIDAHGPLRPAQWPRDGWARATARDSRGAIAVIDAALARRFAGEEELWLSGFPGHDWAYEVQRVARLDAATGQMVLVAPPPFGFAPSFRFRLLHARAALETPGTWHRDAASGRVVVWPRPAGGALEASLADGLLVIEGARHVRIEHLILEAVRGDAVVVNGGSDIAIAHCLVRNVAGRAVVVEGAQRVGVAASHILDIGDGGVVLSGGDRPRLEGAGLYVTDTRIERFARLGLSYRPAVSLHGVGAVARGNLILDGPHAGLAFTGNGHRIEGNEIARVVRETADAGAIYTGRDWTAQGTIIRHNFLHDIRGEGGREVKGIYLDDLASGITIEGNVLLRVDQPVFIGGGRDNRVLANLMISAAPGVHLDGRGLTWARDMAGRPDGELRTRLGAMPIASPLWRARYPALAGILADTPAAPRRNRAAGNVAIGGALYRLLPEVDRAAQDFEPEAVAARRRARVGADMAQLLAEAQSAARIAALLAPVLEDMQLRALPLARMDRAARLPPWAARPR